MDSEFSFFSSTGVERLLGITNHEAGVGNHNHHLNHSLTDIQDGLGRSSSRSTGLYQEAPSSEKFQSDFGELRDVSRRSGSPAFCGPIFNDPIRLREPGELHLAEMALASGLPNEVDVALNSLLALSISPSSTSSTSIRLSHCKNLLNLLMAVVGIFDDSSNSFVICDPVWKQQTHLDFLKFWHNMIEEDDGRVFLRSDVFINSNPEELNQVSSTSLAELFAPSTLTNELNKSQPEETLETTRVLLVATVMVNLVTPPSSQPPGYRGNEEDDDDASEYDVFTSRSLFPYSVPLASWRENARHLAANPTALRFAFLSAYARHSGLRQLGLQLLSQLRYPLEPPETCPRSDIIPFDWSPLTEMGCRLGDLTLSFIVRCVMTSPDRASLIGGLHFLAKLATLPARCNETSLLHGLPCTIWPRLAELICLPDLTIVCAGLKAIRCLTNLGPYACAFAWQSCLDYSLPDDTLPLILLQPLRALLTLEGQAMGSQSLHRVKLMQRIPQSVPPSSQYSRSSSSSSRSMPSHRITGYGDKTNRYSHTPPQASATGSHRVIAPANDSRMRYPNPESMTSRHSGHPSTTAVAPSSPLRHPVPNRVHSPAFNTPYASAPPTCRPVVYRPPSNSNTSCTGLINLLSATNSSTTSSSPSSEMFHHHSSAYNNNNAQPNIVLPSPISSSPPSKSFQRSPNILPSNVTCPSIAELNDRMQMPPPSLPPPSALRRSIKTSPTTAAVTRCNTSNTPTKPCGNSINASGPDTSPSTPPHPSGIDDGSDGLRQIDDDGDDEEEEEEEEEEEDFNAGEKETSTGCDGVKSTEPDSMDASMNSTTEEPRSDEPKTNGPTEALKQVDPRGDSSAAHYSPLPVNGVKPSILQAAVEALNERKLENVRELSTDGREVEMSGNALCNGLPEKKEVVSNETCVKNKSPDHIELLKRDINSTPPMSNGPKSHKYNALNGHTEPENPHFHTTNKNEETSPPQGHVGQLQNGLDNSESGSSSGSSENESSPDPSCQVDNTISRRKILRKRRRYGSRGLFFRPKRRRENPRISPQKSEEAMKSCTETSPLKPLPIESDPVPGSVLDPTWKAPWSPTECLPSIQEAENSRTGSPNCSSADGGPRSSLDISGSMATSASNSSGSKSTTERLVLKYSCEWDTCSDTFVEKHEVSTHVYETHLNCPESSTKYCVPPNRRTCRWRNCPSPVARAPFALMTHVLDVHCSSEELHARRLVNHAVPSLNDHHSGRQSTSTTTSPLSFKNLHHLRSTTTTVESSSNSGGGDQSAWSIIKSMEVRQMQAEMWAAHHHFTSTTPHTRVPVHSPMAPPPREGPVTKHLRVTAALVIRNFILYLKEARTWLNSELPLLSELLMGCSPNDAGLRTNDASLLIAQCLAICNRTDGLCDARLWPHTDASSSSQDQSSPPPPPPPPLRAVTSTSSHDNSNRTLYSSPSAPFPFIRSTDHNVDLDANLT